MVILLKKIYNTLYNNVLYTLTNFNNLYEIMRFIYLDTKLKTKITIILNFRIQFRFASFKLKKNLSIIPNNIL